jgi:hypothetical protein
MALEYFPLSRIKTNLYTRGTEYTTEDGAPYTGRYYITYDNKAFTGISPVLGTSEPLYTFNTNPSHDSSEGMARRSQTRPGILEPLPATQVLVSSVSDAQLTQLLPYYPAPLATDYARGYFTRYFAKEVTGPQYIIEISALDWSKLKNGEVDSRALLGYEYMDMLWQLTGPLNDTRKSQYQIVGGVYNTNKRVTESKQKGFRGIVEFIGEEYTKYAKIDEGSVATSGSI